MLDKWLNWEALGPVLGTTAMIARRKAHRDAKLAFKRYYESLVQDDAAEVVRAFEDLRAFETGAAEFSAVGRAAIAKQMRVYERNLACSRGAAA